MSQSLYEFAKVLQAAASGGITEEAVDITSSDLMEVGEILEAMAIVGEPRPEKAGVYLRFRTQMDSKVCPYCAPLNGLLLPLPKGIVPDKPYWHDYPPIHPRCRCGLELEYWQIIEHQPKEII